MMTEKRSAKREQSLRHLFKSITQHALSSNGQEILFSKIDDILLPPVDDEPDTAIYLSC